MRLSLRHCKLRSTAELRCGTSLCARTFRTVRCRVVSLANGIIQRAVSRREVMARGSINHLALTVSDPARSIEFYDKVLGFMGYQRVEVPESTQQLMKTSLLAYASPDGSLTLRPAKGSS